MAPREEVVRSRSNPLFKRLRALKERGVGPTGGLCLLEGPKLVEEALAAGVTITEAAVTGRGEDRPGGAAVVAALRARGVPVRRLDERLLGVLSDAETSQGLLALAHRPPSDEGRLFEGTPLILVAVGVQNPGNLGGLVRTAEASGATGAFLVEGCADPFSWKALRGSMGSAFRLPLARAARAGTLLDRLDARGVNVFATAADGETRYDEADLAAPVALVFGGEGAGLADEVARRATARLRIPLASPVESLNVGVAAGLVLFEAARQRGFAASGEGR
ncbi:MAG: RNA methyltransferase [Acidobacteria bacterium]|jgi:TrmH family RNA methyltransferase|nr:RNA methyltransferase [Acidobacteriota bacterium]